MKQTERRVDKNLSRIVSREENIAYLSALIERGYLSSTPPRLMLSEADDSAVENFRSIPRYFEIPDKHVVIRLRDRRPHDPNPHRKICELVIVDPVSLRTVLEPVSKAGNLTEERRKLVLEVITACKKLTP